MVCWSKKGAMEAETLVILADVFFLLLVSGVLLSELRDVQKNTTFEKAYVASDLAALLATIQVFAGDVVIEYTLPLTLTVELRGNEVVVSDDGAAVSHIFPKIITSTPVTLSSITKFKIVKKGREVTLL